MSKKIGGPIGTGMKPCRTKFGEELRKRRLELNLGQVKLAKRAGLAPEHYGTIERGERQYPEPSTVRKLAKALQCDESMLLAFVPKRARQASRTELGKLIRARREDLGWSPQELAKKLNVGVDTVYYMEREGKFVHVKSYKRLVLVLKLEPAMLIKFVGAGEKKTVSPLGQLIRTHRLELDMTQGQLAGALGISHEAVSFMESGRISLTMGGEIVERLAKALALNVNDLRALLRKRRTKQVRLDGLPAFLMRRRLELGLTRQAVAARAGIFIVSPFELGSRRPSRAILDKLAKALECEIPPEFLS